DIHFGPSVAADSEVSLAARTEPPATAAIIRACLNLRPLAETIYQRQSPGGCHDPLARFHGGQARNGWCGLRGGLDDFRSGRARGHHCGLDSRDLTRSLSRRLWK